MNKALLVIDVQEDIIGEKPYTKRFNHENPEQYIKNINSSIAKYKKEGYLIVYVAEVFPRNLFTKIFVKCMIRGTDGAKLVKGMDIASEHYFEKIKSSAFSNAKLCRLLAEKKVDKVVLCGFDESACVSATAKAAVKLDLKVSIIKNSVGTINEKVAKRKREKLKKMGVKYI